MSIGSDDHSEATETIQASDVEAYMDKQRLKSLFEARNKAAESIRDASLNSLKAQERGASPELAQQIVNNRIAACVRAYISECEPLLRNTETGRQLLYDDEVASFTVPYQKGGKTFTEIVDLPAGEIDGREVTLCGLDQYLRFDSCTVKYGRASFTQKTGGFEREPALTKQIPMPVRLSESIFRELNDLLAQLDIGLSAETDDDEEVDFDYSHLI
jgi:hypothetical protein